MDKIQMVDLHRQYLKIKDEIQREINTVLDSSAFINGPQVKTFQKHLEEYLHVKHVIPCGNGTDALQISMMALGLKPGDEVITTDFTFIATAEVIALLGLKPVLVDISSDSFEIDIDAIKKAITSKTKAIVPVHLYGQCAPMEEIMEIARIHNLYVIEDACQAMGSEYIFKDNHRLKAGTIGDMGCTSFFPSKNLGCYGDGGAIFTNNDELAEKLRRIANHGMKVRYYHDEIGVNSRLDTLQACILDVKLKHLDEYNQYRSQAANYYSQRLAECKELRLPDIHPYSTHIFHQYTMICEGIDRNELQEYLKHYDIPSMIYYPVPIHLQKAYQDPRYKEGDFPNTENISKKVLSLPIHTELTREEQDYIIHHIKAFIASKKA